MSVLTGKKVLLGITGGIAAYKTAFLVRHFIKAGADVKVVMTDKAKNFITPLTLSTLSKNPVISSFTQEEDENEVWIMIVAPATANTLTKMANGVCDNFLLAVYLSAKCPIYFAPAMDLDMYKHESTSKSFEALKSYNNIMIPAAHGELASGLVGEGRMAEPEDIVSFIEKDMQGKLPLVNKKVLITAGPTHEAIDPVRFIGNHSTGRMGFELATTASNLGAEVILVTGPTNFNLEHNLVTIKRVTSAEEMYQTVHEFYASVDIAILSAAVADYKPKNVSDRKIKKTENALTIELEPTKDILASIGKIKEKQFLVGFALETNDELENAKKKLTKKNLDAIVLNSLNDEGAGFGKPTNKITFIDKEMSTTAFELKSKSDVAKDIFNEILKRTCLKSL